MKKIQVFDPSLCCSTGVCGADVDQELVRFAADAAWAREQGLDIARVNLSQEPLAFAENPLVKAVLQTSGEKGLPLTLVDGVIHCGGRYPTRAELASWAGKSPLASIPINEFTSSGCCGPAAKSDAGSKCC
jgi:hypothetical protein